MLNCVEDPIAINLPVDLVLQVSAAAGLGPDGGLYGGSLLPGEVQDEATVSTHTGITLISR